MGSTLVVVGAATMEESAMQWGSAAITDGSGKIW